MSVAARAEPHALSDAEIVRDYLTASMIPDPDAAAAYMKPGTLITFTGGREFDHPRGRNGFWSSAGLKPKASSPVQGSFRKSSAHHEFRNAEGLAGLHDASTRPESPCISCSIRPQRIEHELQRKCPCPSRNY